ncbi:MAG: hypothetical protein MJZ23_08010 [Paludibacteraceae bacterium]|nr:hypothetical protein [Paludibacteraceae bacterium]
MKRLSILLLGLSCAISSFAQDVIITRDAKRLETKVTEIGVYVVKYKLFSEADGPTYVLPKNKIAAITYQNGRIETYFDGNTVSSVDSLKLDSSDVKPAETVKAEPVKVETKVEEAPVNDLVYTDTVPAADPYPTFDTSVLDYEENVKGVRFKIDAGALLGAHEYDYGYRENEDAHIDRHRRHFDDTTVSLNPGLQASLSVGYQFNPVFYLGVGFDFAGLDGFDWITLSEFLDLNIYCLRYKRTSPIIGVRAGISSLVEPEDNVGFMFEPSVGFCHRFNNPKLSLGASLGYRVNSFDLDEHETVNGKHFDGSTISSFIAKVYFSF